MSDWNVTHPCLCDRVQEIRLALTLVKNNRTDEKIVESALAEIERSIATMRKELVSADAGYFI